MSLNRRALSKEQDESRGPGLWTASAAILSLLVVANGSGCILGKARLAADSLSDRPGVLWPKSPQYVHVGETVLFDLLVWPAIDDYAVFDFPTRRVLVQAGPQRNYRASFKFDQLSDPKKGLPVRARAYRVCGLQDVMMVQDRMIGLQSPGDPGDEKLASASLRVVVYQSRVVFPRVGRRGSTPDWSKTFLRLVADAGRRVSRDIPQAGAGIRTGYLVTGPDSAGRYTVTYLPTADQVNRGGTTLAELHLIDSSGRAEVLRREFSTP